MAKPKPKKIIEKEINKGGRPLKYTPELIEKIRVSFDKYIEETEIPIVAEFAYKNNIPKNKLYHIEGLNKTIKKCISKKETQLERGGLDKKKFTPMHIFSLKQLGWKDNPTELGIEDKETINIPANNVSNIYIQNYHSCNNDTNITINRGGTSSTKTVSLAQIAMTFLLTGKVGGKTGKEFDIIGDTLPFVKSTAMKEFWKYADEYNLTKLFTHKKTEKQVLYKDRVLNYFSADDEKKVKGRRRDFVHLPEGDSLSFEIFKQIQMRTNCHTFIDFNPDNEFCYINEELEQKRAIEIGDVKVIQSSYLDNPFLNDKILKEIEMLKTLDPEYWQIFGLGNYGSIAGLIFKNWQIYSELPESKFIKFYGMDLGFSNDPTAMVEVLWEKGTPNLYIKQCFYDTGMSYSKVQEEFFKRNPENLDTYCDTNEPRLIGELRKAKANVFKPKKDVLFSISLLQSFNLFIHEDSTELIKEFKIYKWQKVKGIRINKPLKFMDHLIDALRYAVSGWLAMHGQRYKILKTLSNTALTISKKKKD